MSFLNSNNHNNEEDANQKRCTKSNTDDLPITLQNLTNNPNTTLNKTHTALTEENLLNLPEKFGCPLWIYDASIIRKQIKKLRQFDVIRFAQKACSNVHILKIMREEGVKVDAVSAGEIERALVAGYKPLENDDDIVFTADIIDDSTLALVINQKIPVNVGSIDMLEQLGKASPNHRIWLRVNPGFGHGHSQKTNTGGENSKHGIWHTDLQHALAIIERYHLHLEGIHMHIGSGVDYSHLGLVCDAMVQKVIEFGQDLKAISAGGGLSIPYREGEESIDINHYYGLWNAAREKISEYFGHPVKLEIEPGRYLVAESGVLMAKVRSVKDMGPRHFVLIDAGFNDLMRPCMYGSYHHISAIAGVGRNLLSEPLVETVVAGPLCESGDVFTQQEGGKVETRILPLVKVGDYLVIHNTGAYGASMSSNYNSRPLLPEVLFDNDNVILIRRRQTIQELLALELTQ